MATKTGLIIGDGSASVNQILPHMHKPMWDLYLKSKANQWMPTEIPMNRDILQWETGEVSDDEKHMVEMCLGFFAGSESLVANNLDAAKRYIDDAECKQYITGAQQAEEGLHNLTIVYICESLHLNQDRIYEAYRNVPSIKAKDDFLMQITTDVNRIGFDPTSHEGKLEILKDFLTYWVICEGIFFFSGFAMLLSLGRQNKLTGLVDQMKYTLRDETNHIAAGIYMINNTIEQNPQLWSAETQQMFTDFIKQAVELEIAYAKDVLPNGILGLNADMFIDYMYYIGNRRLEAIGLSYRFPNDVNPFPWLGEQVDVKPLGNFFERRVREYRNSSVLKDDW